MAGLFLDRHFLQEWSPYHQVDPIAITGTVYDRCVFSGCSLPSVGYPPNLHTVSHTSFLKCTVTQCHVGTVALDEVMIDTLKIEGGGRANLLIVCGAVFRHVTFKGSIGSLKVNLETDLSRFSDRDFNAKWHTFYRDYYRGVDWAVDIRDADFKNGMDFRWVPGSLVRRNPETQVLVSRQRLDATGYKHLPLSRLAQLELRFFVEENLFDDLVIAVFPRERGRDEHLRDLAVLRESGLAVPD